MERCELDARACRQLTRSLLLVTPTRVHTHAHQVTSSSWFADFQADISQRLSTNFGASVRALSLTGEWTQRTLLSTAASSFK
jgi:hypothetical protein